MQNPFNIMYKQDYKQRVVKNPLSQLSQCYYTALCTNKFIFLRLYYSFIYKRLVCTEVLFLENHSL